MTPERHRSRGRWASMWDSRSDHGWGGPGCRAGSVGRRISRPPARGQVGWDATSPGRAVPAAPRGYTRRADGPSKTVPLAAFPLGAVSIGGRALWWRGYFGAVAQLVAHHTGSVGVRGSSPLSSTREAAGHRACRTCSPVLLDWPRRGRARHVPDPSRAADNRAPRWRMKPGAENTFKHTALTKLADRERRSSAAPSSRITDSGASVRADPSQ